MRIYFLLFFLLSFIVKGASQKWIEETGHYIQLGLPITALGMSVAKKDKQGVVQFVQSMALQTSTTAQMKRTINRTRPNGKNYSFPSGHTSLSFMSATYIQRRYGWNYGIPAYTLAAFVGYSRFGIDEPVHHFSDVLAGAALGYFSSWVFTKQQNTTIQASIDSKDKSAAVSLVFIF